MRGWVRSEGRKIRCRRKEVTGRKCIVRQTERIKGSQQRQRERTDLFGGNGSLTRLSELLNHTGITPEILFATDENNGETSAEVHYFRDPLRKRVSTR